MTLSGVGSLLGLFSGGWIGSTMGKTLGGTGGQTAGMTLGGILGGKVLAKAGSGIGDIISKQALKGVYQNAYNLAVNQAGGSVLKRVSAGLSATGNILKGAIGAGALAGIGVMIAGAIVSGIMKGIENSKKQLQETYNEISESYSNALSSSANTVEYDKLAKGVDYLGRNVSLTSEEYQQFLDLSNKLAEAFPDLVVRTDEYGNKLVGPDGLTGKVGEVSEAVDNLVEKLKESSTVAFFNNDTGSIFSGFLNRVNEFFSTGHADLSVFGQQFNDTAKQIKDAEHKLGRDGTYGLDSKIVAKENYLATLNEGTEEYNKVESELKEMKAEQEAYEKVLSASKQQVLEYTDALIDYAATADGIVDVGYKFSGLSSTIKAMDEDEQTFINAMVKIRGEDVEYTNMDEFKTQILSISQQMTELVKDNPIIVDLYYGTGEFTTVGASDEAKRR